MKRTFIFALVFVILISLFAFSISANDINAQKIQIVSDLRAGGGSSGGGGGGGGGGSSSHHHHTSSGDDNSDPIEDIIGFIIFILLVSFSSIVFRFKLSKRARNTKKLMKLLVQKDNAWKYKSIQKTVRNAYFIIQKAWTASDMSSAKAYMSKDLYESFNTKLSWMEYQNKRNVLKRIRLKEAVPVALHDNEDDSLDFVWFFIKGRMIDYHIDTTTNEITDGSKIPSSFCEYWQFTRTETNEWVLNAILQEDEADQIPFND